MNAAGVGEKGKGAVGLAEEADLPAGAPDAEALVVRGRDEDLAIGWAEGHLWFREMYTQ